MTANIAIIDILFIGSFCILGFKNNEKKRDNA